MIRYTSITLAQAVDEVMLRLSKQNITLQLDWQTVATFVNRARREVLSKTLPFKDWAYVLHDVPVEHGRRLPDIQTLLFPAANPVNLPITPLSYIFIKPIRVVLAANNNATTPYTNANQFNEARFADAREFFTLSDWRQRQAWNMATYTDPIYTLWGTRNTQLDPFGAPNDHIIFFAAPNTGASIVTADHAAINAVVPQSTQSANDTDATSGYMNWQTGTQPANGMYYQWNVQGFMDCYVGYPDTLAPASQMTLPYEFENMMVMYAVMRCLAAIGDLNKLAEYQTTAVSEQMKLRELYIKKRQTEKIELQSMNTPEAPVQPQQNGG